MPELTDILALTNDILQAFITIFGASVVLYNLPYVTRDRVLRAYSLLLAAVVVVFFTELLVSRAVLLDSAEIWLTLKWLGITFVPAIQFQFSDTLLVNTGSNSQRRRFLIGAFYSASLVFYTLVIFTDFITANVVSLPNAVHFQAGTLFIAFAAYYWLASVASIYNVWRALQRTITTSTRRRLRTIFFVIMAAPLSVFPYLSLTGSSTDRVPAWAWLLLIAGNGLIGIMFSQLTANIIYIGGVESSRVMRVRLLKFMARVPMTASIVLLVYVLTVRATNFLGLASEAATAFTTIGTLMLVEWAIHAYKAPIERTLHFNNEPDVKRIQELSERLITRQDMQSFLETLLAAGCDQLRVPTAFVAAFDGSTPRLAAWVGARSHFPINDDNTLDDLPKPIVLEESEGAAIRWWNYWIQPLYSPRDQLLVGILGIEAREDAEMFDANEEAIVARIAGQVSQALEDQLLQQSVFAAVEGLLPTVTALQKRRELAQHAGASLLDDDSAETAQSPINSPDFQKMVKDALDHFWGGPKLTDSPLLDLKIVKSETEAQEGNAINGLRAILQEAIDRQRPEGEQSLSSTEWVLYNILELKFVKGGKVRPIARRLAMSESDLYRKQRVAIENVARAIADMERGGELPIINEQ